MEKHGCPLSRNFYSCGKCSQSTTGYYNLDEGVRGQSLDLINQSIKQRLYSVRTTWPARNNLKRRLYTKPFTHTIIAEHRWTLIIVFMSHVQRFVFVCLLRFIQFALYWLYQIRAVNLSGECSTPNELKRDYKNWKFIGHKPVRLSFPNALSHCTFVELCAAESRVSNDPLSLCALCYKCRCSHRTCLESMC